ncbi:MAG: hypothetical protein ACYDG2_20625, partial [Ruminiclostridium sp.]
SLIWSNVSEPGPKGPISEILTWDPATPPVLSKTISASGSTLKMSFWPDSVSRVDLDEARNTAAQLLSSAMIMML